MALICMQAIKELDLAAEVPHHVKASGCSQIGVFLFNFPRASRLLLMIGFSLRCRQASVACMHPSVPFKT